jgi:hypothetical protein
VEAVSVVSPLLAWDAVVLLVVGTDYDRRRRDALQLMAEAALDDASLGMAQVVVVAEPLSPSTMADAISTEQAFAEIVSQLGL